MLICLGLSFLFGQGWLLTRFVFVENKALQEDHFSFSRNIPLILLSGIIFNYGIVLSFQSLKISLIAGCVISILGISNLVVYIYRHPRKHWATQTLRIKWFGTALICLLYLIPMLTEPLTDWDARSIWFFHAKMIYAAGSIGQPAGWQHPSASFSHPDYPNLVPTLAAEVAYLTGFWNEYIPKISLFFMLVPAISWLFTFARRSFSFVALLLFIPFSFHRAMWNGLMDGFLALYFSIAMLLLGNYIISSIPGDMIAGISCLITLLYIKNEGSLAALTGFCIILLVYGTERKLSTLKSFLKNWRSYTAGVFMLAPFLLWGLYKHQWHLSNDLGLGSAAFFWRIINRLADGSYTLVFQFSYQQIEGALLILGVVCVASFLRNKPLAREIFPALMAALIYYSGMIIIYLATPYDLTWHLGTSIDRTMSAVIACIFVGCYFILRQIETDESTINRPHPFNT